MTSKVDRPVLTGGFGVKTAGKARRLLWPALTTLVMLAITIGLGVWQLERLQWKTGLLAELDRAEASPPVPLTADPAPFSKVEATGHMRDDLAAYYGAEVRDPGSGPVMGAQLITPLERPGAATVLVDRGWLPDGAKVPPSPDPDRVVGYVRPPESPPRFGATEDPVKRRFFGLDPTAIGAAMKLDRVAPFTLVEMGPATTPPEPAHALPRPPNDHFGYALTWFGLAAALLGVFATYIWRVLRP